MVIVCYSCGCIIAAIYTALQSIGNALTVAFGHRGSRGEEYTRDMAGEGKAKTRDKN